MTGRISVRCWGTRGSIPVPGPNTARYGGNTSCVELRLPDGRRLVLDAGTGIRALGRELAAEAAPGPIDLYLTHCHWDHIQGLPFFAPLYDRAVTVRVHGPAQEGAELEAVLRSQMSPVFFPVPLESLAATLEFHHLEEGAYRQGEVEIAAMRVRHGARTFGYRVRVGDRAVAYIPDNELAARGGRDGEDSHEDEPLARFLGGVDLLLHDATWIDGERGPRERWGHSTAEQAVRLAERAGVRALALFHHAPGRSDHALDVVLDRLRRGLADRGSALRLYAASEGVELAVEEHGERRRGPADETAATGARRLTPARAGEPPEASPPGASDPAASRG